MMQFQVRYLLSGYPYSIIFSHIKNMDVHVRLLEDSKNILILANIL